jgi:hypothetical protein
MFLLFSNESIGMGESVDLSDFGGFEDHIRKVDTQVLNNYSQGHVSDSDRRGSLGGPFKDFPTSDFDGIAFDRASLINALIGNSMKGYFDLNSAHQRKIDSSLGKNKDRYTDNSGQKFEYYFSPERMFEGIKKIQENGVIDLYYPQEAASKSLEVIDSISDNPEYQDLVDDAENFEEELSSITRDMYNGINDFAEPLSVKDQTYSGEGITEAVRLLSDDVAVATHSSQQKIKANEYNITAQTPEYLMDQLNIFWQD